MVSELARMWVEGWAVSRGAPAPVAVPWGLSVAVVDQVETAPDQRRRGLGRLVMRRLTQAALDQGATVGVLDATADGQALYESLGWAAQAPLAGSVYKSAVFNRG